MAYNGSGTFLINSTGQPVVANTVISATVFNALTADLASGLTNCITKDGQSTPTANIPMGSNKITGLANGTLIGDAANLGQVQSTVAKLISITGTDTVLGTMSPTLTAYAAGQLFYFIASGANTGAVTLNIDGLGAKAITRDGSTALAAGDINSGEIVVVIYDGTRFQMINAANSFGNTTINGTLTVTGNTGLQANVSVTSALSVGGTFAVTGAATLGSTLAVTGKSDLPTVSTASANAAVAVITDLSATGASITSANVGTAVVTTGTVTNLTATSASVASVNAGVALLTTATVTNLTATGASIASANIGALSLGGISVASANFGVAVVTDLRAVGASVTSANLGTAVVTNGTVTNLTATSASVASVNAAVALLTTATVTTLTATGASIASANIGNLQFTAASIASINAGVAVINNLTATSASIASANVGTAVITTGAVTNLTSTAASVASANVGVALITTGTVTSLTATGASVASANVGTAVVTGLTVTNASVASLNAGTATITTGNLTFSSTAQRITGDMSNATFGNRLAFQTSTTNGATDISVIPNGTGVNARHFYFSNSDATNASLLTVGVVGADATIRASAIGSGTSPAMTFYTGGSERVRIDTSGNVGIGTASPGSILELNKAGSGTIGPNLYLENSAASATGNASRISFGIDSGASASSPTAYIENVKDSAGPGSSYLAFGTFGSSLAERMRIDSSGNVGIGTASPSTLLHLSGSAPILRFTDTSGDAYAQIDCDSPDEGTIRIQADPGNAGANTVIRFDTDGSERMRIDSSGNLLVGTSAALATGTHSFVNTTSGVSPLSLRHASSTAGRFWWTGPDSSASFLVYNDSSVGVFLAYGGTSWTSSSDERMKTDLKPIENAAEKVSTLRAVTGRFKTDEKGVSRAFLIAQDVQAVLPEAVNASNPEKLGVAYTDVIPLLVAAIKELSAKVAALEAK